MTKFVASAKAGKKKPSLKVVGQAADEAQAERARALDESVAAAPPGGVADGEICAACLETVDFAAAFYGHKADCAAFNEWWAELEPQLQAAVMDRKWATLPDGEIPAAAKELEPAELPEDVQRSAELLEQAGDAFDAEPPAEEPPAELRPAAADQTPPDEEDERHERLTTGPQVHEYTEKRSIDRYLDEHDKQHYSDLVMQLYAERDEVVKEKNAAAAKFAARIKEIDVQIDKRRKAYKEGYEKVEADVLVRIDRLNNAFTVRRLDTGQVITRRELTDDERQLRML